MDADCWFAGLTTVDLVLTPTASVAGWRIDELDTMVSRFGAMHTSYWNATGNPALALPMGFSGTPGAGGLPLSMQLAGPPFAESLVLRAGEPREFRRARRDSCTPSATGRDRRRDGSRRLPLPNGQKSTMPPWQDRPEPSPL